jgi:hypothetical protein
VYISSDESYGLVPYCAAVGDLVAILDGVRYPVVLRSQGEDLPLMGDMHFEGGFSGWNLDCGMTELVDIRSRWLRR